MVAFGDQCWLYSLSMAARTDWRIVVQMKTNPSPYFILCAQFVTFTPFLQRLVSPSSSNIQIQHPSLYAKQGLPSLQFKSIHAPPCTIYFAQSIVLHLFIPNFQPSLTYPRQLAYLSPESLHTNTTHPKPCKPYES